MSTIIRLKMVIQMSHEIRVRNIKYAKLMLDTALTKEKTVTVFQFITAMKNKMQVREETALSYWDAIKEDYKFNGRDIEVSK